VSTAGLVMHVIYNMSFSVWLRKRLCVKDHLGDDVKWTEPPAQKHVTLDMKEISGKMAETISTKMSLSSHS